jgi:PAS domain S-box-containing protein
MTDRTEGLTQFDSEKAMLVSQSLKYAEDIARVYEEEKAKRRELEDVNATLLKEIEERRRAEDELRLSEERFRAIFETAEDCIYIKDRTLTYTAVNPAMAALLQLPASAVVGRTDAELFGPEAAQRLAQTDRRVLEGESIEEEHTRPIRGTLTTFLETKVPLRDRSGKVAGLFGIARNITDRRRRGFSADISAPDYPSAAMRETLAKARLAAAQDSVILLLGESGAGKDFLAEYIHAQSARAHGPFFAINCASVAPELAESELFGHEAGAFTSARARKRGLFELAEGGTLFLNEIGELTLPLQAKLLTFLDTRSFTRVGGEKRISVNARLLAATNRNLEEDVEAGRFRRDLYYRLNVLAITIPPLRERVEDIPVLVRQITANLEREIRLVAPPEFPPEVIKRLQQYSWPGNVRELRNRIERALILSGGGSISISALELSHENVDWRFQTTFPQDRSLNDLTREFKHALLVEALRRSGGSRLGAARLLKISRNSMNHYLKTLDIQADLE